MTNTMPAAEVDITEELVRVLLRDQHADVAELPLTLIGQGWDNVMYRLGDEYAVRLPRRESAAPLVHREHEWLPKLAPLLPLPIPTPVRIGRPGFGYPWHWSLLPWFDGEMAQSAPLRDTYDAAMTLGRFVRELNVPAPAGVPTNQYNGGPGSSRFNVVVDHIATLPDEIDRATLLRIWDELRSVAVYDGPPLWVHGDLHPANIIVRDGALAAVIDFGDLAAGDRSVDIASGIMLLEPGPLEVFRDAAGVGDDDGLWRRAYGWAFLHGVYCVANSADNPVINSVGRKTLAAVLRDCG